MCCMLVACSNVPADTAVEQLVLDQFSAQVKNAKSVTANISVKNSDGMEVSSGTAVLDFELKQLRASLKTPNTDFTAGTPWITEESTKELNTDAESFGWQVKDFGGLAYDVQGGCCSGVIGADIVNQLGLTDVVSSAEGSVNVKLYVSGNIESGIQVSSVEFSYRSVNGNAVNIAFTA